MIKVFKHTTKRDTQVSGAGETILIFKECTDRHIAFSYDVWTPFDFHDELTRQEFNLQYTRFTLADAGCLESEWEDITERFYEEAGVPMPEEEV